MRGDHSKAAPTLGEEAAFAIAALQVFFEAITNEFDPFLPILYDFFGLLFKYKPRFRWNLDMHGITLITWGH